jgi:GR25 family glycosyltransferase involved in LPS biosynthesis
MPETLVINLAEREDKWNEIKESFSRWPVQLERLDAVRMKPGWKGCAASHIKAIRLAKERGLDMVIILEDDALLVPGGIERFETLLPVLKARREEWDIFLGGATYLENIRTVSLVPPLFQAQGLTTHFTLVNSTAFDKILNGYNLDGDLKIDEFYRQNLNLWMTNPHIATQRAGLSDIGDKVEDYDIHFNKASSDMTYAIWHMFILYVLFAVFGLLILLLFREKVSVVYDSLIKTAVSYLNKTGGRTRSSGIFTKS